MHCMDGHGLYGLHALHGVVQLTTLVLFSLLPSVDALRAQVKRDVRKAHLGSRLPACRERDD